MMKQAERQTRSHLMSLFERQGFHPRGDLGQNFLIDLNLLDFIVAQAELSANDVVLEIGAGTGGLTTHLAEQAGRVVSVEYDWNVHRLAAEAVADCPNVTLLRCDALKNKNRFAPEVLAEIEHELAAAPERRLKLVANLPYNIATPVVSNLVKSDLPWTRMVVTIQIELAERMLAGPGTAHYGSLSVWLQSQTRVSILRRLPPNVFWPRPQVISAIIAITPDPERRAMICDRQFFHDYVRRVFQHRRKMLRSVLCGMYGRQLRKSDVDPLLATSGFSEQVRAEELNVAEHVQLANLLNASLELKAGGAVVGQPGDTIIGGESDAGTDH
jgi:16S rRNA (adenine1518-N6/adenine1519-N6)-dimethyltransferase